MQFFDVMPRHKTKAGQRSQSAPVLASREALNNREARNRTVRTTGCGPESPTSWQQLSEIRCILMNTQLWFRPEVKLEIWKGHLYAGVWWQPYNAPLSILRPENWHTTLLRCWHPLGAAKVFDKHLELWMELLTQMMHEMLNSKYDIWGRVPVWLRSPPWRQSWTFGVPLEVIPLCEILQKMLTAMCQAVSDDQADLVVDEFHISWN